MSDPNNQINTTIKNLTVAARPHPNGTEYVVGLKGSVESYNAEDFKVLLHKITEQGHYQLVFDCTELEYVSSIGIGTFMNLLSVVKRNSGSVVFAAVSESVARIFENLGFTVFFQFREKV